MIIFAHRRVVTIVFLLVLSVMPLFWFTGNCNAEQEVRYSSERLYGLPGLSNVGRVSPSIYRGDQPDAQGYKTLKEMGIKTVLNLRAFHSEKKEVEDAGMRSVEIPINMFRQVNPRVVEQAVAVLADPENQPVYVHCALGEDRTGTVIAVYRISRQGWPFEAAMEEMQAYGFNDIWIHIKRFLESYAARKGE